MTALTIVGGASGSGIGSLAISEAARTLFNAPGLVDWWTARAGVSGTGTTWQWVGQKNGLILSPWNTIAPSVVPTAVNGKPAVRVAGNGEPEDEMGKALVPLADSFSIVSMYQRPNATQNWTPIGHAGGLTENHLIGGQIKWRHDFADGATFSAVTLAEFTALAPLLRVYSFVKAKTTDGSYSGEAELSVNGVVKTLNSAVAKQPASDILRLGAGDHLDLLVFNWGVHSDPLSTIRQAAAAYFTEEYVA